MDRRILKTRNDIRVAFITLLKQKSFDQLSIKDLTEAANINRATFYKHFEDKHDLLAKYEEELIGHIQELMAKSEPIDLHAPLDQQPAFETLVAIYDYIAKEHALIEILISVNGNQSFLQHMQYLLEQLLLKNLTQYEQTKVAVMPKELIVVYLASAHIGIIRHWLLKKLSYTSEEMASMMIKVMIKGPVQAAGFKRLNEF